MSISSRAFGTLSNGTPIHCYRLTNASGSYVEILNFGAIIRSWHVADKNGQLGDIVLGFDSIEEYEADTTFQGAVAGRIANRIKDGQIPDPNGTIELECNNGRNHLHGGSKGFNRQVWTADIDEVKNAVHLTYISPDGEAGYPGTLTTTVTYSLNDENALQIHYHATTDKRTYVNLTNHVYFNLQNHDHGNIYEQILFIDADRYTLMDEDCLVTGEFADVSGTPMDFRTPKSFSSLFDACDSFDQCKQFGGVDHSYWLNRPDLNHISTSVFDPTTGRKLLLYTDQPDMHLYTGNNMPDSINGKNGAVYPRRGAFCLETQHFPDSPHHPNFPSIQLDPNETFESSTIFQIVLN